LGNTNYEDRQNSQKPRASFLNKNCGGGTLVRRCRIVVNSAITATTATISIGSWNRRRQQQEQQQYSNNNSSLSY
jgi:hypothetical protein